MAEVYHVAYSVCQTIDIEWGHGQIKEPVTIKEVFASEHEKKWKAAAD